MIPAILSCVFVIYLYQTLNASVDDLKDGTSRASHTTPNPESDLDSLVARMRSLQTRLEKLSISNPKSGDMS